MEHGDPAWRVASLRHRGGEDTKHTLPSLGFPRSALALPNCHKQDPAVTTQMGPFLPSLAIIFLLIPVSLPGSLATADLSAGQPDVIDVLIDRVLF